jgi:hypothetical protein
LTFFAYQGIKTTKSPALLMFKASREQGFFTFGYLDKQKIQL